MVTTAFCIDRTDNRGVMPDVHRAMSSAILPVVPLKRDRHGRIEVRSKGDPMATQSAWQSSEAYVFVDDLSPAQLAWEWLRRNEDYRRDYAALSATEGPEKETLAALMRARWELRFPD